MKQAGSLQARNGRYLVKIAGSGEGSGRRSGHGRAVPAHMLSAALYARYRSRGENTFGKKPLSAMRFGFGGQVEPK